MSKKSLSIGSALEKRCQMFDYYTQEHAVNLNLSIYASNCTFFITWCMLLGSVLILKSGWKTISELLKLQPNVYYCNIVWSFDPLYHAVVKEPFENFKFV